jgi:hypothetical protein
MLFLWSDRITTLHVPPELSRSGGHDGDHRVLLDQPMRLPCTSSFIASGRLSSDGARTVTTMYAQTDRSFATRYWEWFFFVQEYDFPEKLLSGNPEAFLRYELGEWVDNGVIVPEAWSEYLRALSNPTAMHGMCEDYRAGSTIDLGHDAADSGQPVLCPLMVLWATRILSGGASTCSRCGDNLRPRLLAVLFAPGTTWRKKLLSKYWLICCRSCRPQGRCVQR